MTLCDKNEKKKGVLTEKIIFDKEENGNVAEGRDYVIEAKKKMLLKQLTMSQ